MSFLSSLQGTVLQGYAALQGTQGQPQSATDTLTKLVDRLQNAMQHEDRRSSLLGIKGMARDWKHDVGRLALPAILEVLCREDLADDVDMAKAVLETLHVLCEVEETDSGKLSKTDSGLANVDVFLKAPAPAHALLMLLSLPHFYIRFFSLQLLGTLLTAPAPRPHTLQSYLLTAPGGLGTILSILDDTREIIRNEALLLLISITEKNADIQKIVAFEGGFDRLFNIINLEGGIGGGGIVVQDCLICVGQLLRYNVSNQNYFRETSCIPHLAPMLLFPPTPDPSEEALDAFATQPWTAQKVTNAALIISLARTLVAGAGTGKSANQKALLNGSFTRCLAEIGLASTCPPSLKAEALHALASLVKGSQVNQDYLGRLVISPIAVSTSSPPRQSSDPTQSDFNDPHPSTSNGPNEGQGPELYREPPQAATLCLISLSIDGLPGLRSLNTTGDRDILRVRAAAVNVLDAYLFGNPDAQTGILSTMNVLPPSNEPGSADDRAPHSPGSLLLEALRTLPAPPGMDSYTSFFACLIFTYLLRGSERAKEIARAIRIGGEDTAGQRDQADADEDMEQTSLVQLLLGNLMMTQRSQSQDNNAGEGLPRSLDWARVMIGYLIVLASWLWDSPLTTTELLNEGTNLHVLIEPVGQASGVDPLVQGLCAFVLGIVYENDRDPNSPIPRATLQPILQSRVGPDQFVNRILRLREDPRFRDVGPDVLELVEHAPMSEGDDGSPLGLWFDWSFVEFLKANYVSVQHSILSDPIASSTSQPNPVDNSRQNELIANLKAQLADQAKDLHALERKVDQLTLEREDDRQAFSTEINNLTQQISKLKAEAERMRATQKESEKEQEDLLVLLEEVTNKRKKDKALMKERGLDVSEDEDESE